MSPSLLYTLLAVAFLLLLFAIRGHWIVWQAQRHGLLATYWARRTQVKPEVAAGLGQVWSTNHILLELWCWDWRRYVVDQESYDLMCRWVIGELRRTDLTMETYLRESGVTIAREVVVPEPPDDVTEPELPPDPLSPEHRP